MGGWWEPLWLGMGKLGGWPFVLSFEEMEQGAGRVSFPLGLLTTWNWGMNRRKWRCSGDRVLSVRAGSTGRVGWRVIFTSHV